jgi:dTDP-4-dehydrorhamnose reductase
VDPNTIYHDLLRPSEKLIAEIASLEGDVLILGAGGKMGPALATLAKDAIELSGVSKKVLAVARFSDPELKHDLDKKGIITCKADLLEDNDLRSLPDAANVLYLAGTKFGTTGNESLTWTMNAYLPGRVADRYRHSRIVAFSTGNVYPLVPVKSGGATETTEPSPLGEYAQSCLGRERVFQHFSSKYKTPMLIYRLNYANDVTYGVLLEIGRSVKEQKPLDLRMGYVNVIWQGDANEIALRSLAHCSVPPKVLNVTGPKTTSVRMVAEAFGKIFKVEPKFINEEQDTALLSNAAESIRIFGPPRISVEQMIDLVAAWINAGGRTLDKPTHFQEREGRF